MKKGIVDKSTKGLHVLSAPARVNLLNSPHLQGKTSSQTTATMMLAIGRQVNYLQYWATCLLAKSKTRESGIHFKSPHPYSECLSYPQGPL
jgi:hypothetical protein